jgi:hypothetical protein
MTLDISKHVAMRLKLIWYWVACNTKVGFLRHLESRGVDLKMSQGTRGLNGLTMCLKMPETTAQITGQLATNPMHSNQANETKEHFIQISTTTWAQVGRTREEEGKGRYRNERDL